MDKEYTLVDDEPNNQVVEIKETIQTTRVINFSQMEEEITNIDLQINFLKTRKAEILKEKDEAKKSLKI